jgi:hypothetical protein
MTISLEKTFEQKAPELLSLAKKASISLSKLNLTNICAEVAFVLDASGSMHRQYKDGHVQQILNRVFPLAVSFDDNQSFETWAFAQHQTQLSSVTFDNYKHFVNKDNHGWEKWMEQLDYHHNNEPAVMRAIIEYYTGLKAPSLSKGSTGFLGFGKKPSNQHSFAPIQKPKIPVWVLFISDGGVAHNEDIEFLMHWSSTLPIFWQFIGIGGNNYGALEKLDTMEGRFIDNANFFSIDSLNSMSEGDLYNSMIQEFPSWIKLAKEKNLITDYTK